MKSRNLTPWNVVVYSGHAHWDKRIDELEEAFATRKGARAYAETIKRHNPKYDILIVHEAACGSGALCREYYKEG